MEYIPIGEILAGKFTGKKAAIRGWVYRERKQKAVSFFIIRDVSGVVQTAIKPESKFWDESQKLTMESSVEITGTVKEDKRAPGGYELQIDGLKTIGLAERFPIGKDLSEEFLRDVRHLWIRSRKMTEIMKVRSAVFDAIHEFYQKRGFYQIQSPSFTGSAAEGGSTVFEVKYFDKKAYLTQSWQLYAEAMIFALEKIYTFAPSFRAEKSRTIRHLAEYWHHEMEAAWMGYEELLKFEEELIVHVTKYILAHCRPELKELGRDTAELEQIKAPFGRITYADACKKLDKKFGDDITDKEERDLVELLGGKPVFLTHFPRDMKAFYMRPDPKDPKLVLAADLLMPKVGETTGGSERVLTEKDLLDSIKIFKLDRKDYEWYIDLRKYGSVPHSGFGLGIERLVMWLTGAPHVMDAIPFPRTMDRLYP